MVEAPEAENIKVVVRCRPMNENERAANYKNIVQPVEESVTLSNPATSEYNPPKMFTFDYVFGPDSTQLDIYNLAARPIIDNVLEGYNGTGFELPQAAVKALQLTVQAQSSPMSGKPSVSDATKCFILSRQRI